MAKRKIFDWRAKLDRYFISFCRKSYQWSVGRKEALASAFVCKGIGGVKLYRCAKCRERTAEPKVDHIEPVVPTDKPWNRDWNMYRDRLFDGQVQVLCDTCHNLKTARETIERKQWREKLKNEN